MSAPVRRHELSEQEWQLLAPLIPQPKHPGRPAKDHRTVINGMLWILHTGAPWRDLPERYGPWQTVYSRFRRWQRDGTWERILGALQRDLDAAGALDWELWMIDGTNIRAHRSAAGARGKNPPRRRASGSRPRAQSRRLGQQGAPGF
jgi:transposase